MKKSLVQKFIARFAKRLKKYGKTDERTLELKALLRKVQNNWNPSDEFKKQVKREWNEMRIKTKKQKYSVTISYQKITKTSETQEISNDVLDKKLILDRPMTESEAISHLKIMEDELNAIESGVWHKLIFISVDNLKIGKSRLEESRMFKMNYDIYNNKISEFIDTGKKECCFEYLMHRYNGVHNLRLTKERIYDIIFQEINGKERNFKRGLSCMDLERFCQYLNISMYCVDVTNDLFYKYLPEKASHHYPVLCFVCSNNHLYPIEKQKFILSYRNIAYNNVKSSSIEKQEAKAEKKKEINVIEGENLNDMLDDLVYNEKKLPSKFKRINGNIQEIVCGNDIYKCCENIDEMKYLCKQTGLEFNGGHKIGLGIRFFTKLYEKHTKSVLNSHINKMFLDNNKSTFSYTFREPTLEDTNIVTYDFNRFYTSILLNNKYEYPKFDITDDIVEYNGHLPLKCGFYYVESDNIFPLKGNGFYPYNVLIECQKLGIDFNIKYQALSSQSYPPNYFVTFVEKVLKLKLDDEKQMKKLHKSMINNTIGYFNKKRQSNYSKFTSDKGEADYFFWNKYKSEVDDNRIHYVNKWNNDLYEIETFTYDRVFETDMPLYQMILCTAWIGLYKLSISLGGDILAVKTDSVTISNQKNIPELSDKIGGLKKENNPEKYKKWKIREGKCDISLEDWDTVNENQYAEDYDINDGKFEWTENIVEDYMTSEQGLLIDAGAGTGKSYSLEEMVKYCKENNKKYIVLAPTNISALNINGITIHKFFGINRCGNTMSNKIFNKLKNYEYVFVDEIGMVSSYLLRFLYLAKLNNSHLKFILVGHSWQLKPVKEKPHLDTQCIKFLADHNKLELIINKRFDKDLADIANKWYLTGEIDLKKFGKKTCKKNLCYTNKTRKQINDNLMKKYKRKKHLELPLDMKYEVKGEKEPESQDMILTIGTPVIARKTDLKYKIAKNKSYTVVDFDKRKKIIEVDCKDKKIWDYDEFREYFLCAYCTTIHKSQSLTFTDPYTIHEFPKIKKCSEGRSLMYVALTRSRSLDLINISREKKEVVKRYNRNFIEGRINGYIEQDKRKNMTNDLTVDGIQDMVDRESNICYYCRRGLHRGNFTLDRVDSQLSHNLSNVVLCCKSCNCKKSDLVLDMDTIG